MTARQDREAFEAEYEYHRREWIVQRIGWFAMLLFVAAAALGFFGEGMASDKTIGDANVSLRYERFARYASPAHLELSVGTDHRHNGTLSVSFDASYLEAFEVESIVPEPTKVETSNDRVVFTFESRRSPATVTFDLIPEKIGSRVARVAVGGRELQFKQFIYP